MEQLKLCEDSEGSFKPHFKLRTFDTNGQLVHIDGFFNLVIDMENNKRIVIYNNGRIEEKSTDGS